MTQCCNASDELSMKVLRGERVSTASAIGQGYGAMFPIWRIRSRTRDALRNLTPEQLNDIGITAAQARRESAKWFWQA